MKPTAGTSAVLTALAMLPTGCQKKEPAAEFIPTDPVLLWANLGVDGREGPEDNYVLVAKGPTAGLFPAAVAVARVKAGYVHPPAPATVLEIKAEPEDELLPWNSILDDQRTVSGVFPIKPIALQGELVTVNHILDAASAMQASVCLVYGTADLTYNESEVRGALFDTRRRQLLAVMHARALIDDLEAALTKLPPPAPFNPEHFHAAKDPRYHDAPGMAIYKFEHMVRQCIIALRKNDKPVENLPTEGWVPERPRGALSWPTRDRGR